MAILITSAFPPEADFIFITTGTSGCKAFRRTNTFLRSVCSQITDSDIYPISVDDQFSTWHRGHTQTDALCGEFVTDYYPTSASIARTLSGTTNGSNISITTPPRQDQTFTFNGTLCGCKFYGQFPVEYDVSKSSYIGSISGSLYTGDYSLTGSHLLDWSVSATGSPVTNYTNLGWYDIDLSSLNRSISPGDTLTLAITGFKRNTTANVNTAFLYYNLSSNTALSGYSPRGRSELTNESDYNINYVYTVSCA